MLVAALTGGIGSGKSTFAALLAEKGARVINADALGHEALHPGEPTWHSVVSQFGEEILTANSMEVDRRRLAELVFADRSKLAALNAIVHPYILERIADELEKLGVSDEIVVLDAALVLETAMDRLADVLIAVQASKQNRITRLTHARRMMAEDVAGRMAAQMDAREIAARADIVVNNDGSMEELAKEAERVWAELEARRGGPP